jgi:hypothetical protein
VMASSFCWAIPALARKSLGFTGRSSEKVHSFREIRVFERLFASSRILLGSRQSGVLDSGSWIEVSASRAEVPLRAMALLLKERPVFAVCSLDSQYYERAQILQAARNSVLDHEKLLREIQKKEILLHCIIHDLSHL